jgi:pimeloyl-ACP methyl ester carboxylesterase
MLEENHSPIMEEAEFIIKNKLTHREHKNLQKLLVFTLILIITLTCLYFNRAQSYNKYERIQFESSGATLFANLYYPSNELTFQEKQPLIIYCHGFASKRDFDLRIPIEFTKRGFYVAALDYQGHGESGGNINNIDPLTGVPALAQDCSRLLDKLETLPFYSRINSTQVGLIGHSLGGMVVLMNQALDPRFKVTVALAPLVNFTPPKIGFLYNEDFIKYIPVNLLNAENTRNLLIIMHVEDEILDFTENALKAQELTNCTVIPIRGKILGGGHQLFSDSVLIHSINWFEHQFFRSSTINGPIIITFYLNYVLIFLNILLIFIIVISLISVSSQIFFRKKNRNDELESHIHKPVLSSTSKRKSLLRIPLFLGLFLLNLFGFQKIFGLKGILYGSLCFLVVYVMVKLISLLSTLKQGKCKLNLNKILKTEFNLKYFIFTIICTVYFIGIYMMFSYFYPFGFIWPSNFVVHFMLAYFVFPIFLSIEILLRKVIHPLLNSLKSESSKNKVLLIATVLIMLTLMMLSRCMSYFPSVLFMNIIFLLVIIQNTKILQNLRTFYPVVVTSFTIVQIFFATVLSNVIGVNFIL